MAINNITQNISSIPQAGKRGIDVQTIFVNKQEAFQDALTNTFVEQINTLRNQLNTFVGEVNSTASQVNAVAISASSNASLSSTKANEASTSASQALTSRNQAETFKNNANDSALKAGKWADNPYNVEVETGKYSARHYAETAQNIVNNTVDKTTNQNIDGVKTFVKSPVVPTPTIGTQVANKEYVDTKVSKTSASNNSVIVNDGNGGIKNSGVYVDDNGNVGIGVTPSDWSTYIKAIEQGSRTSLFELNGDTVLNNNAYVSPSSWTRKTANACTMYEQLNGGHYWSIAPSGTAGSPFNWTNAMALDITGNLLLTSGTGALGYGAGAGGTVTQLTDKNTAVTLNKPTGRIKMHNSTLASGQTASFTLYNNLIGLSDTLTLAIPNLIAYDVFNYRVNYNVINGSAVIFVTNVSGSILSEAISINFNLHKGSIS